MNLKTAVAPVLAEQYADMLALDFRARHTLLTSYSHNMGDLLAWDARMQAYIEGLLLLQNEACAYFDAQLASPLSRGDVFALGSFAAYSKNGALMDGCCRLAQAMPHFMSVMGHVIEWAPTNSILWSCIDDYPALRLLANWLRPDIRQAAQVRPAEIDGLLKQHVLTPALVYGMHGQSEYTTVLGALLQSADPRIIWGVLTAILTRHLPDGGLPVQALLCQLMQAKQADIRLQATQLSLLCTSHSHNDTLAFIEGHIGDVRLYIQAMGVSGSVLHINTLRQFLNIPEYARLSAASISMITGAFPEVAGWANSAHPGKSAKPEIASGIIPNEDPDAALSWPDASAFDRWWQTHAHQFDRSTPYLGGYPATEAGLMNILQQGVMALRPLAALRLQQMTTHPIFSLSAPADVQHRQMQFLTIKDNPAWPSVGR